jgi:hypothetical protein
VPPRVQPVEVRHAILAQDHALAIEHEGGGAQPTGGLNDQWKAIRPVEAAPRLECKFRRAFAAPSGGIHRV